MAIDTKNEPTRQIHLDFHTSEHIPDIGAAFDKGQFQEALKMGKVNLINVFAKCHHGWSYYPTKIGSPHPNLTIDLLGGQIEACHEIGVAAPIYYTMGWSANDAEVHPDWCARTENGEIEVADWDPQALPDTPKPLFQWKNLCPSGDYHEHIMAQTDEICGLYPVDGFWYDIYMAGVLCYCDRCRAGMREHGFDAANVDDVEKYRALTIERHCEDLVALIHARHPKASIYFNGLTSLDEPRNITHRLHRWNTKNDLEDLPTTWSGYDKFPLRAKVFLKENKPIVAMSGKFHTSWGEFGGFKEPEALRYEAASMIAFGARCNFGDQLHPSGIMDPATYRNIGHAYDYVEKIENLGIGGVPVSSLGFWFGNDERADEGLARLLMEEQIDFDVIGSTDDDLSGFQTIVVPSVAGILEGSAERIERFLAGGGSILILGDGLLRSSKDFPAIDAGLAWHAPTAFDVDYTVAGRELARGLPESPFLNYTGAFNIIPGPETEVLAARHDPYFSRTYATYCGHQNTPYRLEASAFPAVVKNGNVIVSAHPLDRMYYEHGAKVHRTLFANALRLLHTRPMVEAGLPSAGRVNLLHFADRRCYVLHLLYAPPLERGRCLLIEDMPPLRDVPVTLRLPAEPTAVHLEPEGRGLKFTRDSSAVELTVPEFSCHCALRVLY